MRQPMLMAVREHKRTLAGGKQQLHQNSKGCQFVAAFAVFLLNHFYTSDVSSTGCSFFSALYSRVEQLVWRSTSWAQR